jgi:hypothetical protein
MFSGIVQDCLYILRNCSGSSLYFPELFRIFFIFSGIVQDSLGICSGLIEASSLLSGFLCISINVVLNVLVRLVLHEDSASVSLVHYIDDKGVEVCLT